MRIIPDAGIKCVTPAMIILELKDNEATTYAHYVGPSGLNQDRFQIDKFWGRVNSIYPCGMVNGVTNSIARPKEAVKLIHWSYFQIFS